MAAEIAAIVGNHQGEDVLRDCIESLRAQTRGARLVRAENKGLGFLYNLGARAVECEYLLLSNNDVAYERECLARLAAALDADAARFAADPTQLDWAGRRVIHARTRLGRGRLWREYLPGLHLDDAVPADSV